MVAAAAAAAAAVAAALLLLLPPPAWATLAAAGHTRLRFESVSVVNNGSSSGGSVSGVPENFYAVKQRSHAGSASTSSAVVGRVAPWQISNSESPGKPLEQRWRVSTDAGLQWGALHPLLREFAGATYVVPLLDGGLRFPSGARSVCPATRQWDGDARWHLPDLTAPMTSDGWASLGAVEFQLDGAGQLNQSSNPLAAWSWQGVDAAGGMNVSASRRWYAPRVYSILPLPDSAGGGYLAVVAVFLQGNVTINYSGHLSLLAFRSKDGLAWQYAATIVKGDDRLQQMGPTEPDLAVLSDGKTIICVIRMDGDGACGGGGYKYYYQSYSTTSGQTWSAPTPINGTGCARPRLLKLSEGPLLLSGGRLCVEKTKDLSLWVNDDGLAGAHGGDPRTQWVRYSLSYWHNLLWHGDPALKFTTAVNDTTATESLFYTSIVSTGPRSFVVLYNRYLPGDDMITTTGRGVGDARGGSDGLDDDSLEAGSLPWDCVNFAMRITVEAE